MSDFDEVVDLDLLLNSLQKQSEEEKELRAQVHSLKSSIAEIAKQYDTMMRQAREIESQLSVAERNKQQLEKDIERAKRLQEVQEQAERLKKEFAEKAAQLDELTASAKWREFAFDHQIEGGKRLAIAKRAILGDKRGLGKTLTSLIWADMVQAKKIIVLAPNDVVPQFEDEIRTWAPSRTIFSLRGLDRHSRSMIYPMLGMLEEFIVTLNYEAWRRDKTIIDDLVATGLDTIICDEAHRIKSANKQTAQGVFQLSYRPNFCSECHETANFMGPWRGDDGKLTNYYPGWQWKHSCGTELTTSVANVLCMTGTPILNKPQELFSMLHLVDFRKFPSESRFLYDYCYKYAPNKWRFLSGGLSRLTEFMSDFFIQRDRESAGIQIPPPQITIHRIDKDPVAYPRQYEAERNITQAATMLLEDGTKKDIFFILEMILRERQCMTWPAGIKITDPETKEVICNFDVTESQKLDTAMELLNDLAEEGERVVVFSQFVAPLQEMHRRFVNQGYTGVLAIGGQSSSTKELIMRDFDLKYADKDNFKYQACFATYKAFGTGINLNAARHMILLDDEWNPGMEDQAIGRIDRLNSTDQANVHIFRVNKSIDVFMEKLLEEKRGITSGFNEAIGAAELLKFFKE